MSEAAAGATTTTTARWRWGDALALAVALIVAIVVRVRYAEPDPSYDEVWHLALSVGRGTPFGSIAVDRLYPSPPSQTSTAGAAPWWDVWTHMTLVLHPPLYCTTLRFWRDAFGDSIAVARAYTLVWSLVAITFTASIARLTMGSLIAALVALAMAVAPTQVYLGQEIRGYAMLSALGAIGLWLMTRVEVFGPSRRRAIALGIAPLPMLLTHYFAFGGALAIGLFGVWRLRGHRRAFLIALAASAIVYSIAWLPFAIRQSHDLWAGDVFLHVDHRDLLVEGVLVATAPYRLLADRRFAVEPLSVLAALLFVVPWFLRRRLSAMRPWALWLACGVGTLCALDLARSTIHLGYARYLTVATPAVFPLIAGCAHAIRRRAGVAVAGALALLMGVYLHNGTWIENDIPTQIAPIHALGARARPGEGLIVALQPDAPYLADILMLHCWVEPGLMPRPVVEIGGPMSAALVRQVPRRSWLLSTAANGPPERVVPGARVLVTMPPQRGVILSYLDIPDGAPLDSPATAPAGVSSR